MKVARDTTHRLGRSVALTVLLASAAAANAETVTFTNIMDGNAGALLFNAATTAPDAGDGNTLNVGLNNFTADGSSIATTSAVDTLSFTVEAPAGFFITSVGYTEGGSGTTTDGVAAASGFFSADGISTNFLTQLFPTNASSDWTITPTPTAIANKTSVDVSLTNSLLAFAFSQGAIATISKTSASFTVGLTPIPLPAAVWMLGAAMFGLLVVGRRRVAEKSS